MHLLMDHDTQTQQKLSLTGSVALGTGVMIDNAHSIVIGETAVVGNDVSLAIQRELYLEFREPGFAPAPLLEHLVTAGYLGRKTKRGFRDYSAR